MDWIISPAQILIFSPITRGCVLSTLYSVYILYLGDIRRTISVFVLQDFNIWLDSNSANYLLPQNIISPNSQLKTTMFAFSPHSVSHEAEVNLLPVSQDSNNAEATMSKTVSPSTTKHLHIKKFLKINLNQFYNCYQRPNSGDLNRPGSARCVFQGPYIRERWAAVKQKDNFSVPSLETTFQVLTIASDYKQKGDKNKHTKGGMPWDLTQVDPDLRVISVSPASIREP